MRIFELIVNFYRLQALMARALEILAKNPGMEYRHSIERFMNDLRAYFQAYSNKFARALYDYIVKAAIGETTNALDYCEICLPQYFGGEELYFSDEEIVRENCEMGEPVNILKACKLVFSDHWYSCFGGEKWLKAVEYALQYGKIPDEVFIDFVVDLQHNTGSLFSKSVGIFNTYNASRIQTFCEHKNHKTAEAIIFFDAPVPKDIIKLTWRFVTLFGKEGCKIANRHWYCYGQSLCKEMLVSSGESVMDYEPLEFRGEWLFDLNKYAFSDMYKEEMDFIYHPNTWDDLTSVPKMK